MKLSISKVTVLVLIIFAIWLFSSSFLHRNYSQQQQLQTSQLREELTRTREELNSQREKVRQMEDKLELVRQQLQKREEMLQRCSTNETEDNYDLKEKQLEPQQQQQQQQCPPPPTIRPCVGEIQSLNIYIPTEEQCRERFGDLAMRKIYTYYQPIPTFRDDTELLDVWKMSWRCKCWLPIILDESHAAVHPDFASLNASLSVIPTVNPKLYERSCYIRYIALSMVGGGITVDNDVMNMGFWPTDAPPDPLPERLYVTRPDTRVMSTIGSYVSWQITR